MAATKREKANRGALRVPAADGGKADRAPVAAERPVRLAVYVPPVLHRKTKVAAAQLGVSMSDLVCRALTRLLADPAAMAEAIGPSGPPRPSRGRS